MNSNIYDLYTIANKPARLIIGLMPLNLFSAETITRAISTVIKDDTGFHFM
jgi:hypothetical protein